jgi:hypothetical protein
LAAACAVVIITPALNLMLVVAVSWSDGLQPAESGERPFPFLTLQRRLPEAGFKQRRLDEFVMQQSGNK